MDHPFPSSSTSSSTSSSSSNSSLPPPPLPSSIPSISFHPSSSSSSLSSSSSAMMDSALALLDLDYLHTSTEPSSSLPPPLHSSPIPSSLPLPPLPSSSFPSSTSSSTSTFPLFPSSSTISSSSSLPPSPIPPFQSLHTPSPSPLLTLSSSFPDIPPSSSSSSSSSFPPSTSSFPPSTSSSFPSTSSSTSLPLEPETFLPPPHVNPPANPEESAPSLDEIPVFYPTPEEFRDFSKYVSGIEGKCKVGLAKIVPPKEWHARRSYENMPNFLIQSPIVQHFFGSQGVFKQLNIERKSVRIAEFEKIATEMDHSKLSRARRERARNEETEEGAEDDSTEGGKIQFNEKKSGRGKKRKAPSDAAATTSTSASASSLENPEGGAPSDNNGENNGENVSESSGESSEPAAATIPTPQDSVETKSEMPMGMEQSPPLEQQSQPPLEQSSSSPTTAATDAMKVKKKSGVPKADEFYTYLRKVKPNQTKEEKDMEHADLERMYWKSISFSNPMYGADMQGSLFDKDVDVWNVSRLGCLLDRLPEKIPGVNQPYLYIGMWRATFSWHVEDMDLFSINYIHFGAPKTWYVVPIPYRRKFEAYARTIFPEEKRSCPEFLRHKTCLINPQVLQKHGIPVRSIVHEEGEFMITFPGAYHAGFNNGFNCAESINFALESWIETGKAANSCQCQGDAVRINMRIFTGEPDTDESESDSEDEESSPDPKEGKVKRETKKAQKEKKKLFNQEQREENRKAKEARREERRQKKAKKEAAAGEKKIKKRIIPQEFMAFNEPGFCHICMGALNDADMLSCRECEFYCHRDCYGFVSEETKAQSFNPDWKCIKCFQNSQRMGCIFCPMYGGCFKMTESLQWGHVSCGMWIPEVTFADDTLNEYIVGIDSIPNQRWNLKCSICKIQHGACIQCTSGSCAQAFHVTCAQKRGYFMSLTNPETKESEFRVCCPHHDPRKKEAKGPATLDLSEYEVGKEVWGRWSGGFYYHGTIAAVHPTPDGKDASITVEFKDGASKSMKSRDISLTRPKKKVLDEFSDPVPKVEVLFPIEASIETIPSKRQRKSVDYKALNG